MRPFTQKSLNESFKDCKKNYKTQSKLSCNLQDHQIICKTSKDPQRPTVISVLEIENLYNVDKDLLKEWLEHLLRCENHCEDIQKNSKIMNTDAWILQHNHDFYIHQQISHENSHELLTLPNKRYNEETIQTNML